MFFIVMKTLYNGGVTMKLLNITSKGNKNWIYIGILYGMISVLLINFSLYTKLAEGIFILKPGVARIAIEVVIFGVSLVVALIGYLGYRIFSLSCYVGFSCGTLIFFAYSICRFCGFEFVISTTLLIYVDLFTLIAAVISQVAADSFSKRSGT